MNWIKCIDCPEIVIEPIDGRCTDCHILATHKCGDNIHIISNGPDDGYGECLICDKSLSGPFAVCEGCERAVYSDEVVQDASLPYCWDCWADDEFDRILYLPRYVVVVWRCTRSDGGPEEGGWSYEEGERVLDVDFRSQDAACTVARGLEIEYPYTGKRSSVLGGADFSVQVYDRHEDAELDDVFDCRLNIIRHYPIRTPYYS